VDFSKGSQKDFFGVAISGEITFFPLETKKATFVDKNVIGKCQISKFSGPRSAPLSDARLPEHFWAIAAKIWERLFCFFKQTF